MSDGPTNADGVALVQAALAAAGYADRVITLAQTTRTAELAASTLGVPQGAIVKSLIVLAGERPLLALVSGDRRADLARIAEVCGDDPATVRLASAKAVTELTGLNVGGVSPVTRLRDGRPLPTLMDEGLFRFAEVWSAAGTSRDVFGLPPAELAALAGASVADLGQG